MPRWLTVLLISSVLTACDGGDGGKGPPGKDGEEETDATDPRVLVETGEAGPGGVADHLVTTGSLESEAQADLAAETTGVVSRIEVEEGDTVRRGQLLAVLSNPSLSASAERAKLELDATERSLADAKRLHAEGAISDRELREAEQAAEAARSTAREATSSNAFTRITSPIDGTVSIRDIREGEVAPAGQRTFQVVDLDRLRVIARLPEKDLPRIRQGQTVVLSGAYDDEATATGSVLRVSPVVDPESGTVRVTIAVDPGQMALRPGQFVKVRVEVDRHEGVLTIPRRALAWIDGEPVAWKLIEAKPEEEEEEGEKKEAEEPGFLAKLFGGDEAAADAEAAPFDPWEGVPRRGVEKHPLEIGFSDPVLVEVKEGLSEGDVVITVGNAGLREDTLVRLVEDPDLKEPPKEEEDAEDGESAKE